LRRRFATPDHLTRFLDRNDMLPDLICVGRPPHYSGDLFDAVLAALHRKAPVDWRWEGF
jgi:hypothetical protein